ncbi:MAG: FG-GAP-like repeat-containing protein [Gemmatimonadota bacterium]
MGFLQNLPKRKRQIVWTSASAVVFLTVALAVARVLASPAETYRAGEDMEGLTSTLARDLPEDYPRVSFVEVAEASGIDFRHFGGVRSSQLPEDMGSGAAWGDYDNDGWQDLFLVNIAGPLGGDTGARSALYRNLGDGTFADVTDQAGIDHAELGMGAAWADYDGDGWRDLVITAYGTNTLLHNQGDGTFSDATAGAGLAGDVGFWTGAVWADYDRDGDLDLYVTGYTKYSPGANAGVNLLQYEVEVPASLNPSSYRPERNLLYRNDGDATFTEVAAEAGVDGLEGRSLSAAWADFDEDGWIDLYVANDVSDNALYMNRGDGTFENVSHAALVADYRGAMGLAVGDWDGDEDADLFITHWIAQENALFTNRLSDGPNDGPARPLQFIDQADRFGLGQIALDYVGWGTSFFDYDNDGYIDLFVANGSTFQRADEPRLLEPMVDQLFWNRGSEEGFFDVSVVAGEYFAETHVGRGAAFADYDRDGDVDVVVMNHSERPALLRNEGTGGAGWLEISLAGEPIGARVRVVAGGRAQVRWLGVQSSYLSQNSPVLHFGLGDATGADTVQVRWPDGTVDTWTGVAGRRGVSLERGGTGPVELWRTGEDGAVARGTGASATSASPTDPRERTRRFWETYRAATQRRTAGDLDRARTLYAEAHELDPGHEDALYYLGAVQADLGEFAAALVSLDRLVELNGRSGRALMRRGALLSCPGEGPTMDLEEARRSFEAAEAINREQVGPALWLGVVELLAGDGRAAAGHFDDVLGSDHENVAALVLRGEVAWAEGDRETASALFAAAHSATEEAPAEELGLREGDTTTGSALFAGASSCRWLERILTAVLASEDAETGYSVLRAELDRVEGGR